MPLTPRFLVGRMDSSIHEFLLGLEDLPKGMTYTLITRLDSSSDIVRLVKVSPELKPLQQDLRRVGRGALILTTKLIAWERRSRIFFGFDEIWLFDRRSISPMTVDVASDDWATSLKDPSLKLRKWMADNGCSMGLSDGVGLSYCAKVSGVAAGLLKAATVPHRMRAEVAG